MARDYSVEDVKYITEKGRMLLQMSTEIKNHLAVLQKQAKQQIYEKIQSGALSRNARREICENNAFDEYDPDIAEMISNIGCCVEVHDLLSEIQIIDNNSDVISSALEAIRPSLSTLRWFFTGRDKKERANSSYKTLQDLILSDYPSTVNRMHLYCLNLQPSKEKYSWSDYLKRKEKYAKAVDDLNIYSSKKDTLLEEFETLNNRLRLLDNMQESIEAFLEKSKQKVIASVDEYLAGKLVDVMKTISVDELNRDRSGLRIKSLKDYGYTTVADIHYTTSYNLESIPGIGWESAQTLKRRASKYADEMKPGIKVQLNADDQNKRTTTIVGALYRYKRQLEVQNRIQDFYKRHDISIKKAKNALEDYKGGLDWLFRDDTDKEGVIKAYHYLAETVTENLINDLRDVFQSAIFLGSSSKNAWDDFSSNPIDYYTVLEEAVPGILGEDSSYGLPEDLAKEIEEECFFPDGLKCTLRHYQEWGVKYVLHQENVLLGDEMGLGKTVQAIAAMVSLKNTGATHFAVVCPASVLTNWCKEISTKSKLRVIKIHGTGRGKAVESWVKSGGVAVTTYETTRIFKLTDDFRFNMLIVDEAHYIKNPEAKRTENVKEIAKHAERKLFMTGTALENKVSEMISLIRILQPAIAAEVEPISYMATAPVFRERVAPVYFRRKRESVLTELPELIETKEWCELSNKERDVYESTVLSKNYASVRQVSWNVSESLKESCKARRLLEIVEEAEADGRKILVFSFFLKTIDKIRCYLGDRCTAAINGSVPPAKRQQIIDEFEMAPAGTVLPAQIQSGGTGLNIQSASIVVICEPQFKPSVENQAISRAYRMGQSRNVLVHRLLCADTVDERILEMLEEKQAVFDAFADKSVAGKESLELSQKNFGDIINEEIERINSRRGKKRDGKKTDLPTNGQE